MSDARYPALLLLGPTGSGKTPLGRLLEHRGLGGRRCVHFDFGQMLRQIVAQQPQSPPASPAEIEFLRSVLESGVLLENEHLHLAERILRWFLADRRVDADTWVVLNGLPRHADQICVCDGVLDVRVVVCLECTSETVLRRLAGDVGGDRRGRTDDDPERVDAKLEIYRRRTAPLIDDYRRRGARIEILPVAADASPDEIFALAENRLRPLLASAVSAEQGTTPEPAPLVLCQPLIMELSATGYASALLDHPQLLGTGIASGTLNLNRDKALVIPDDPGRRGVVAVVVREGRMLVIRRAQAVVAPLVYCFPGGGIEDGETEEEALVREFREEVGLALRPVRRLWQCVTAWKVELAWWLAEIEPDAVPVANPREVESIHWFTAAEMARLPDLLESNRQFLELLARGTLSLERRQEARQEAGPS